MHAHKHFNLYLHDTDELEAILQTDIVARQTVHDWPLSCVERLDTAEGRRWIYKSQFGPTVEAAFYAKARSGLLPASKTLATTETGHTSMLFEFFEGPLVRDLDLSDEAVVRIGRDVIKEIAQIEGELPYYLDVRTEAQWIALMKTMLKNLRQLSVQGTFKIVDEALVRRMEKWAFCQKVLASLTEDVGYVHHDLGGDNVFVLPDGYRVIDWQRPILGPKALDLATLLTSLGREPLQFVDEGVVWMMVLLRIEWLVECARQWFPPGSDIYDREVTRLASSIGRSAHR